MTKLLLIPAIFLFAGCSFNNLNSNNNSQKDFCFTAPQWSITPPLEKDYVYGVGIAPENFNGAQAQRKSALSKAIDEIATQLNTTVNSQLTTVTTVNNKQGSKRMSSFSFQTVDGEKVSAKIVKSCKNPNNGYLYVLMRTKIK